MDRLLVILITILFLGSYLAPIQVVIKLLPEIISAAVLVFILLRMALLRSIFITKKYVILGSVIAIHMLVGIIVNSVAPGTILTGMRPYLRWLPLFLLPMVYQPPEGQLRRQLLLMLFFLLLQAPVALYQRLIQYSGAMSGDAITGTLGEGNSGVLSILLLSGMAVLTAFYARGVISGARLFILLLVLGLPTAINETKVTFILLPLVVSVPYLLASRKKINIGKLAPLLVTLVVIFGGYITLYNHFYKEAGSEGVGIAAFWDKAAKYLYREHQFDSGTLTEDRRIGGNTVLNKDPIGSKEGGGRMDKILLPILTLSEDPVKLWVGLGVGNVSTSVIGQFSGKFSYRIGEISSGTTASFLLWETGVGGIILFLVLLVFLASDAFRLSKENNPRGILAAGWVGVMLIFIIIVFYLNIINYQVLSYLWAFISGHIVSWRYAMIKQRKTES